MAATATQNGLSRLKYRLLTGQDATLLIWGDSTGNSRDNAGRWPQKIAASFAAAFPAHTILLQNWNTVSTTAYDGASTIQSGSGSATLRIINMSVSGSVPHYAMAQIWDAAIGSVRPDALILNHGINQLSTGDPTGEAFIGTMMAAIEQFWSYWPDCPVAAMVQNPNRDDTSYDKLAAYWPRIARVLGISLIDIWSVFQAAGKPSAWYVDATHPSEPTGNQKWANAIWTHFTGAIAFPGDFARPALLHRSRRNLLVNGDFRTWTTTTAAPDGWTALGTVAFAKDTAVVADPALGYSVKMTGSGSAQTGIKQSLTSTARALCAGKTIFASARINKDNQTSVGTVGLIQLVINSTAAGNVYYQTRSYALKQNGFAWWALGPVQVPADVIDINLRLYHDQATTPTTAYAASFDQACLVVGDRIGAAR